MDDSTTQKRMQAPPPPPPNWAGDWLMAWAADVGASVSIAPRTRGNGNGRKPKPKPQPPQPKPQPSPCPERLQPSDIVDGKALDTARTYEALGDRKEYSRRMEALFVAGLRRLLECEGEAMLGDVVADFAYLLDLSPETIKRYLRKHASRWGEFELAGEVVRLRG